MTRKVEYKPRSWAEYNKSLIERGRVSLWINDGVLKAWHTVKSKHRGAPRRYSDIAINAVLQLRYVFNLTLRATQGFCQSLFDMLGIKLSVPNYSTLSRRLARYVMPQRSALSHDEDLCIAIDSTGLKVYGEGEWKVRIHGHTKRRTWRKLHIGVDVETQIIHAATVTTNDFKDNEVFEDMLSQIESPIATVLGDGAYDSADCYTVCKSRGIKPIFPPRKGAVLRQHGNCKQEPLARDLAIRGIRKIGKKHWKSEEGYHRRSIVETAMYRLKSQFTGSLRSRSFINQANELFIKCEILNDFARRGLANSVLAEV